MSNRAITATRLALIIASTTFACSTSPSPRVEPERADARVQEVREDRNEIPCAPRLVLQTVCQHCHSLPPRNGAPFPLVRRSDILAAKDGTLVRELMKEQLEAGRMPLTPVTIEPEAREVLLDWLRAGAPAVTPRRCDDPDDDADAGHDAEPSDGSVTTPPSGCLNDACTDADVDAGHDGAADAAPE